MHEKLLQKKADRFRMMNALYEKSDGNEYASVDLWELGAELGMDKEAALQVAQYLVSERLAKWVALGGLMGITHFGVVQVERALEKPQHPTEYFPPVVNILNIGSMTGSQIQQAGHRSVFSGTIAAEDKKELSRIIQQLRANMRDLLADNDLDAELSTVEAQLKRHEPSRTVIRESLSTIRSILEGMAGSVLASGVLPAIQALLKRLN